MAYGDNKLSRDSAVGIIDGTGADISIVCGFKPLHVRILNVDGNAIGEWSALMPDAYIHKIVDSGAGTTDISYAATLGITPLFNGFTIGADTDLNVSGEEIHWIANK